MQISPTAEIAALVITFLVHVVGAGILIWNMLDGSEASWRDLWPRDDDGDDGGGPPTDPQGPDGGGEPVIMRPPALPSTYDARVPAPEAEPQRASG